jgi:probable F420-dependent oxidoreductase
LIRFNIPMPFDRHDGAVEFGTFDAVREVGAAIEKAGFFAAVVTDHPCPTGRWLDAGGHYAHDPFVMLSMIASVTTKVKLQTGILVLPYRNPFVVARSIATLDLFSNGRVIVGVGAGYLKGEYKALGVDFDERNELMDEYLPALRAALTGEEFTFVGTGYTALGNRIQPGPVQKPSPPILVGGNAPRAIRRAAALGDGWYPFFTGSGPVSATSRTAKMVTDEDLANGIAALKAHCETIGRDVLPSVDVSGIAGLHNSWSAQRIIDAAGRYAEMGVRSVGHTVNGRNRAEWCDAVEQFGDTVIAKLRG